jgi:methylated-DNA-[protein]-cysteine S-methyltransferase
MIKFAVFDTALGVAGIAWNTAGLVGCSLPAPDIDAARRAIRRRTPDAEEATPPTDLVSVIEAIRALMRGEPADLADAPLDLARASAFDARVYAVARAIPPGETLTYGQVAERLGDKRYAREVGQALGRNPWPIVVPCHRVTAAGGKLGGFSAPGGAATKLTLLAVEGAQAAAQRDLFG